MTIGSIFPGKMGRVELTRVAIRLRMPELLKKSPNEKLEPELADKLKIALTDVRKG